MIFENFSSCLKHSILKDQPPIPLITVARGLDKMISRGVAQQFFPLLKCVIPEGIPVSLRGSAFSSSRSVLKPLILCTASGVFSQKSPL